MLTMDKIQEVRFRFFFKGEKISQISSDMDLDWKTVRKYVDKADFNDRLVKPALERHFFPKLDPFKATIDQWLECDKNAPRKQRHTCLLYTSGLARRAKTQDSRMSFHWTSLRAVSYTHLDVYKRQM